MSGRSLHDIWSRAQQQRQAQINQQQAQIRAQEEQRERARQEWLRRTELNERVAPLTSTSTSSAAAGAGGSGNRVVEQVALLDSGESAFYYYYDSGQFNYFVYNFDTSELSSIQTLQFENFQDFIPVTKGGVFVWGYDSSTSTNKFYFINLKGEVVWQDLVSYEGGNFYDNVDIENFSRYIAAYYAKDGRWKLSVFVETGSVKEYFFDNLIQGGGYSYDDVWNGGFVVREDVSGTTYKFWIINVESTTPILFKEVSQMVSTNVYLYAYSNIMFIISGDIFEIYNATGTKLSEFDFKTEFTTTGFSISDFTFLSSGSIIMAISDFDNDTRVVLFYSEVTNTFSYRYAANASYSLYTDVYGQTNYTSPEDYLSGGSAIFVFYDGSSALSRNNFVRYDEVKILPVWSTDESIREFVEFSDEIAFANGLNFTRNSNSMFLPVIKKDIYYFSDYGTNYIDDGGDDMYDGGNYLYADSVQIPYTHTQLGDDPDNGVDFYDFISDGQVVNGASPSIFGASSSSSYFTNLYPGLFVLAAEGIEIDEFKIEGELGADSSGESDFSSFQVVSNSTTYQVYFKRVWGASDPSVNHIIIVDAATASGITHSVNLDTDSDFDKIEGLAGAGVTKLYYMILSLARGEKLVSQMIQNAVTNFLSLRDESTTIDNFLSNLNLNYSRVLSFNKLSMLRLNREGTEYEMLTTSVDSFNNDSWYYDSLDGKSLYTFIKYRGTDSGTYGWDDLTDMNIRRFSSFKKALNNNIGNNIVGRELVMWDTENDQYWAVKFTNWQNNANGGAFTYTRQLISGGTFSGEVITFTHSNYGSEVDIIDPGVLEITRGTQGPIYNRVVQSESNGSNAAGTLWNSQYSYNWDERTLALFDSSGNEISKIIQESFNDNIYGSTYYLEDRVACKSYISNNQNSQQLTLVTGYYSNYEEPARNVNDTMINSGKMLIYEGNKFRIVTPSSISSEITIPVSGLLAKKYDIRIFETGVYVVVLNYDGNHFYFYDLQGNLIFDKTIGFYGFNDDSRGKRITVAYQTPESTVDFFFFNGTELKELTTTWPTVTDYLINDFVWWD